MAGVVNPACPAAQGPAFHSPGILCNPDGGRCRKQLPQIRACAQAIPDADYVEPAGAGAIAGIVERFVAEGRDLIVVIGGDGTLSLVLTALQRLPEPIPPIALVPAGSTNTAALDLGMGGSPTAVLRQLERHYRAPQPGAACLMRTPVAVAQGDAAPRIGTVFGLGALAAVIENFGQHRGPGHMTGEFGAFGTFSSAMAALVAKRFTGPLTPVSMTTTVDGVPLAEQRYVLVLVSGLTRLLYGLRPYWGEGDGPLHYTAVGYQPHALLRVLPSLLRGRRHPRMTADNGYTSANATTLEFDVDGIFVLDGEIHSASRTAGPLRVTAGRPVRFFRP
ncbi:MAG: hypothetical protein EPN72_04690 [Nevskiaceae bacterium]|nr:MAG: hypothetical protein EPN63_07470 [Nevskiaceae bacterium]TBR74097.1 MAG: hypothetical protein EPN72_04690 [Nevskiaceae bacterium]